MSFEVDDFDPLNQNARQIPPLPKRSSVVLPPNSSSVPPSDSVKNPIYPHIQSRAQAFSNPVYPYHQPPTTGQPKNIISQSTNTASSNFREDENELLRKYGLDPMINDFTKLHMTTNRSSNRTIDPFLDSNNSNDLKINGDIQTKTNNNWTTFD